MPSHPPQNRKRIRLSSLWSGAWQRLRHAGGLPLVLFAAGCLWAVASSLSEIRQAVAEIAWRDALKQGQSGHTWWEFSFPLIQGFWIRLLAGMAPAFVLTLFRRRGLRAVLPVALACLGILLLWLGTDLHDRYQQSSQPFLGEAPTVGSYIVKLVLIGTVIMSPPLALALYYRSTVLDRYVVRSFLTPLLLCLFGFLGIWLVIDLADNGPDFLDAKPPPSLGTVAGFYAVQMPQIVVLILDVTLLLAMLYALGKMSRSNEIISMLGAGRSMGRILLPLFLVGIYASVISLALNYQWAPSAERHKEELLQAINEDYDQQTAARAVFYRNREENRTWFVSSIPIDLSTGNKMRSVEIFQFDPEGVLRQSWSAKSAYWFGNKDEGMRLWRLYHGVERDYDPRGIPIRETPFDEHDFEDWNESPWKLQSGSLNPQFLGVSELRSYLKTNRDLPPEKLAPFRTQLANRWALPWRCLVVILIAAPLGVVFSRRGLLGGVAASVFIFFALFFASAIFLALGEGARLSAPLAAWMTNLAFGSIGLFLLYFRANNKEVPKLAFWRRAA